MTTITSGGPEAEGYTLSGAQLAELRQSYDLLIMKVLSLLQDSDPVLARDIVTSREAIWSLLADPAKFATLS